MRIGYTIILVFLVLILAACSKHKARVYTSDCTGDIAYKKLTYAHLQDSLKHYNGKFVEVQGTYKQGKHMSALVNDSTFTEHDPQHSLWVNFSPDCPLYIPNTHIGLFEAEDGHYQNFNDMEMIIRGRLQLRNADKKNPYQAILNDIIYLKLE